jgi:hypothetical protein
MDYIPLNPVEHGYVAWPLDFKWSSFSTHVKMGNYTNGWGVLIVPEAIQDLDLE